ncbi:MAG: glycosyltransferase [Patescibacteria group bacterium]
MKIGIITNLYPPYARGGAEIIITRLVTELLPLGHDVFVITTKSYDGLASLFPELEDDSTERVYRFYPLNLYHSLRDYRFPKIIRLLWHIIDAFSPLSARSVVRILEEEQPDVVITHNLKGIGLPISRAIRHAGFAHVHHVHDVQLSVPSGLIIAGHERIRSFPRFAHILHTRLCRLIVGSPDVVIFPSRFLSDFYHQRGFFKNSRMVVLPNPAPRMNQLARTHRVVGPLRLLFIGQLVEHKGIRFLMETLKTFDRPFELSIAGDGPIHDWVQETARDDHRLIYVGYSNLDRLVQLFQNADALVIPSLCYENSPNVIYEALQAGVPVVASDIGGVAELIKEGENGFLFTAGNEGALLEAIKKLDDRKEEFFSKAEAIHATVAEHKIDRYLQRLLDLLHQARGGKL